MPKSKSTSKFKKQKTHHHHHHHPPTLSHEEIWDDSALVRSWNDALAEYEYYHSIHARGEDVDEVLRQAELDEQVTRGDGADERRDGAEAHMETEMDEDSADEGEIDDDDDVATRHKVPDADADAGQDAVRVIGPPLPPSDAVHAETTVTAADSALAPGPTSAPAQQSASIPAPTTATFHSADQTLENIKMAYYWAGYYSGLYDGQRQLQLQTHHESGQGG
ncbi:hypothetical protein LTR70_003909 [Exophiala xenobiotica]|uniref:Survival motor neuron Tudor domain-containing protein n=1 Tax=Lithohypha guttulata TaxID=1690604 RepID=A0ABR0KEV0_9EURO|nr:hypothetical protein LTR24_003401 [Lithohypha guttulata]KAK5322228.1 hypothetical protein LTR70_003909 [Exophiala xenobiotica]